MTDKTKAPNALMAFLPSDTMLQNELDRLGKVYGPSKVKAAAAKLHREKRGRKELVDFQHLSHVFDQDARDWLDGLDPFELRTNYSIAQDFAEKHPGHSKAATHRRLMGKLARRRRRICMIMAVERAKNERPIDDLLRAMEALLQCYPSFEKFINYDLRAIDENSKRYKDMIGQDVPKHFSFKQLEEAASISTASLLSRLQKPRGMFGNALAGFQNRPSTSAANGFLGSALFQPDADEEKPD